LIPWLFPLSVLLDDRYLAYTYVTVDRKSDDWSGPWSWTFVRRVVRVIDRTTGETRELIIRDPNILKSDWEDYLNLSIGYGINVGPGS